MKVALHLPVDIHKNVFKYIIQAYVFNSQSCKRQSLDI